MYNKKPSTYKITFIALVAISVLTLISSICYAQNNISIGVYQDARLALLGDDKGNDAFTLDVKIDVSLQGYQFEWYYFEIRPQFEYANLQGGKYISWLVSGGWVFNQLFIKNVEAGIYPTIGIIQRKQSFGTYGVSGDISYKIGRFKISALYQWIKRGDISEGLKPNFYVGVKYNVW